MAVQELGHLLLDMFELCNSTKFDDAIFQGYLGICASLTDTLCGSHETVDIGSEFASWLGVFDSSWKLSTGCSMEALWTAFRYPAPSNEAQLKLLLQVEAFTERFDQLLWKSTASMQALAKLRSSLVSLNLGLTSTEKHILPDIQVTLDMLYT